MMNFKSFSNFISEYQTYGDYQKKPWGSPEDLKNDVIISVKRLLPIDLNQADSYIKTVSDQSDDKKGIKFEIVLKTGDTIHAFKLGSFRSHWEWYLNKKKMSSDQIYSHLEDKMYKPFDRWKRQYDSRDTTYMYADDSSSYRSGLNHEKFIQDLYNKLSSIDKKKADEYMKNK
jgi:hypothetical protein